MRKTRWLICFALAALMAACGTGINEDRVKLESQRSLEITLAYIKQQRDLHQYDLNRKIRLTEDKINKIKGKAQSDQGPASDLAALEKEKAGYVKKLNILTANTDASIKRIKERWAHYNQSLELTLQNMNDYLKGIPIDIDTLPKKDSIK